VLIIPRGNPWPLDAQGMCGACRYALAAQQTFAGIDGSIVDCPIWAFSRTAMTLDAIIVHVDAKQGETR